MPRIAERRFLHPAFRAQLAQLENRLSDERILLVVYETVRTPWRQAELYSRGRTIPQTARVTRAKAWQSMHQYGLAADMVFVTDSGRWTWEEPQPGLWDRYHELARALGLEPLTFERPHVQLSWDYLQLRRGIYPPGGDTTWENWFNEQCEMWGAHERQVNQLWHPGAPPGTDFQDRPALVG